MKIFNNKFDMIFSLGGSCATAKQLQFKKLRICAYPFDWLFHTDNSAICYLIHAFRNDFSEWMLKDHLEPVPIEERGDSPWYQYRDTITGYVTIHDFHNPVTDFQEYESIISKYTRRINRLNLKLSQSKHTLLILDARYPVEINCLLELKNAIEQKYPENLVQVMLFQFNSCEEAYYENNWITIRKIKRNHTNEDYNGEPEEWDILKDITLNELNQISNV